MSSSKLAMDPKEINLKVGLEIHQQLATKTKLFCSCPPYSSETRESPKFGEFRRILRPTTSELGELDEAARFESRREIRVRYLSVQGKSCLVEADEEPPHPIAGDALETSLIFALTLGSRIADEIHVMRKIVVDGSNTSGFQRTAAIALGGKLLYKSGTASIGVQSISLEEDAARAVEKKELVLVSEAGKEFEGAKVYALDRLGTPLVEVALDPIQAPPDEIEDAARTLGRLLRSTGRIARGLGTIRQDLNISVKGGKVIEVKGVQRLDQISKLVVFEASRQKFFYDLANEIRDKLGEGIVTSIHDVTDLFSVTKSGVLKKALSSPQSIVLCIALKKFRGYLGRENEFHSRLGKELGFIAKSYGLGGVFHSDELPNYGITQEEIVALSTKLNLDHNDGYVLVAGPSEQVARAAEALEKRIIFSGRGVPAETRGVNSENETYFLRPRPGAARMYPETDIPLIPVTKRELDTLRKEIPEPWEKQVERFAKEYDLPKQLAEPLYDSDKRGVFEKSVVLAGLSSRFLASVLVEMFQNLSREGVAVDGLSDVSITELFRALSEGRFAKEALPDILRLMALNPEKEALEIITKSGFQSMTSEELESVVEKVIKENQEMILSRGGTGAESALMGTVMKQVRGRADGKLVNQVLSKMLAAFLQSREQDKKPNQQIRKT